MGKKADERRSIALTEETVQFYKDLAEETGFSAHFLMQTGLDWFKGYVERNPNILKSLKMINSGGLDVKDKDSGMG